MLDHQQTRLTTETVDLPLRQTFKISRSAMDCQHSVIVSLMDHNSNGFDEYVGLGEVTQHAYYGHTTQSINTSIESVRQVVEQSPLDCLEDVQRLNQQLNQRLPKDSFARNAIDQAANDLVSQKMGVPLYQMLGLHWADTPDSSITLSMNSVAQVIEQLQCYQHWPIIKLKLGGKDDQEIVRAVRDHTSAIIRIDANCAWTVEETIENSRWLSEMGVEFIEQPLSANAPAEDKLNVYEKSALPIIADESCRSPADVVACHGCFHGINVKLSKCGGVTNAVTMLSHARHLGMRTMAGCMIESEVAIASAVNLLPLLDDADLDGSVLLKETPFVGPTPVDGRFDQPVLPGSGARRRQIDSLVSSS